MVHLAYRKLVRNGSSLVLNVPKTALTMMGAVAGDMFLVAFDDERKTLTFQPFILGGKGPGLNLDGMKIDTVMMP